MACCAPPAGRGRFIVRRFVSTRERVERLQAYASELEGELEAVRERIRDLQGEDGA